MSRQKNTIWGSLGAFLVLLVCILAVRTVADAQDAKPAEGPAQTDEDPAQTQTQPEDEAPEDEAPPDEAPPDEAPDDPLEVPEGGAAELSEFISKVRRRRPEGNTREEMMASLKKTMQAVSEAADRLLEASREEEEKGFEYAVTAIRAKLSASSLLQRFGDDEAAQSLNDFVSKLAKDDRKEVVEIGRQLELELKYRIPPGADKDTLRKLADELKAEFDGDDISESLIRVVTQFTSRLERSGFDDLAIELNTFFADKFASSDDPQLADLSERLAGAARRLDLPGNPIELDGEFLDGTKLDWESYLGKVVLIDFWATWCGPCRQELPNVLANYERYHDHGFEVLAISLDDDREAVEGFLEEADLPWRTLFSDDPEATGWKHPMARRYGVGGIPLVILVDKKGKVVSLNARGGKLGQLLEELIGPVPEPDAEEETEENSDP